jgi:hypothetical protein
MIAFNDLLTVYSQQEPGLALQPDVVGAAGN